MFRRAMKIQIADDRSKTCFLVTQPSARKAWKAFMSRGDEASEAEKKAAAKMGATFGGVVGTTCIVPILIIEAFVTLPPTWPAWASMWVIPISVGVAYWPLAPFVFRWTRGREAATLRKAYLAAGYCASCGHSLATIEADAQGMTLCPECGCSWQLNANGSPS